MARQCRRLAFRTHLRPCWRKFATKTCFQNDQSFCKVLHDHNLIGNYLGCRECHIGPDWLLIYQITDTTCCGIARALTASCLIRPPVTFYLQKSTKYASCTSCRFRRRRGCAFPE
nr:type II toxin-antitoxin system mRNA interferase toxin, RelE/StbE family [Coraliomargarita sinensis]